MWRNIVCLVCFLVYTVDSKALPQQSYSTAYVEAVRFPPLDLNRVNFPGLISTIAPPAIVYNHNEYNQKSKDESNSNLEQPNRSVPNYSPNIQPAREENLGGQNYYNIQPAREENVREQNYFNKNEEAPEQRPVYDNSNKNGVDVHFLSSPSSVDTFNPTTPTYHNNDETKTHMGNFRDPNPIMLPNDPGKIEIVFPPTVNYDEFKTTTRASFLDMLLSLRKTERPPTTNTDS